MNARTSSQFMVAMTTACFVQHSLVDMDLPGQLQKVSPKHHHGEAVYWHVMQKIDLETHNFLLKLQQEDAQTLRGNAVSRILENPSIFGVVILSPTGQLNMGDPEAFGIHVIQRIRSPVNPL